MTSPHDLRPSSDRPIVQGALFALFVLFSMNLLNYVDRYVFAAVGLGIQKDLNLNKEGYGFLGSAFIIVYTIVSPVVGLLGDRIDRRKILAFGVGLWSVATVGTAFARSYHEMFFARAFLGIGEASYGVVAPTLLADFFDTKRRGRVMAAFYLALPVGTAIGYGVGGLMEKLGTAHKSAIIDAASNVGLASVARSLVDWRLAFWVVGIPGLVLAVMGLAMRDPGRGAARKHPTGREYLEILFTPSYLLNTLGMAAITFTTGAFGIWIPTYFEQVHKTRTEDKIWLGLALAGAGLLGVLISMWIPDRLQKKTRRAYLIWAAGAVFVAVPFGVVGLVASNTYVALALLTISSIAMSSCLGPCNTVTANVVPANRRAAGYAASIFLLHLLGDIPSPPLIGKFADYLGTTAGRGSAIGRFFEGIGAVPVSDGHHVANITAGLLLIAPMLLIGCVCFLIGAIFLPDDQARAEAAGGEGDDGAMMH